MLKITATTGMATLRGLGAIAAVSFGLGYSNADEMAPGCRSGRVSERQMEDDAKIDASECDLDVLQGAWTITYLEMAGVKPPLVQLDEDDECNPLLRPIFRGDAWLRKGQDGADHERFYTLKLDEAKDPKSIDLTRPDGKERLRGIYKIEGDVLTLCVNGDKKGERRPTHFATKSGEPMILFKYKKSTKEVPAR